MASSSRRLIAVFGVLALMTAPTTAFAQKHGGILREHIIDSPASMSIHEETTVVAERPMMAVFNNLVMFDQHIAQNSPTSIVPDLATPQLDRRRADMLTNDRAGRRALALFWRADTLLLLLLFIPGVIIFALA